MTVVILADPFPPTPKNYSAMKTPDPQSHCPLASMVKPPGKDSKNIEGDPDAPKPAAEGNIPV
jgi:hypothetical protein